MLGSGMPGAFDDEQQAIREEAMYLHTLDESARQAYFRAKGSLRESDLQHTLLIQ